MNIPELSVVIPVYKSAEIFPELYRRLNDALTETVASHEIIAVVDSPGDGSADVIAEHATRDSRVRLIEFSRNFGHQSAVTAGLERATGEMVVVMDDDLEDPPEVVPRLIEKAREGYDVVYGVRRRRKVSIFRRAAFFFFYRLLNRMSEVDMPYDAGDFCLMRRPVVDALNAMPERNRYIRGLRSWLGFRQTGIEYDRASRHSGESGYTLRRYIRFAIDGLLSFSYRPLTLMGLAGAVVSLISFALGVRLLLFAVTGRLPNVPGWASLMVATLFLGGVQLISIGVLGQYIARVYDEVKSRPQYVIQRQVGFGQSASDETYQPDPEVETTHAP